MTTLLWFRRDLRLADNPALTAAAALEEPVVPIYLLDDEDAGEWRPGAASRWWLHGSLSRLATSLERLGSRLTLRRGPASVAIEQLVAQTGARRVYWNRRYEPWATERDRTIKMNLRNRGVEVCSFNAALLREPWTVRTREDKPYRVFTPFWKALRAAGSPEPPLPAPERLPSPVTFPASDTLASWGLLPQQPDWAGAMRTTWTPGESAARARLAAFMDTQSRDYHNHRDRPGVAGTSRLSPHLHFGEVGPRQVLHACLVDGDFASALSRGVEAFLSEIAWREFSYHLLFHFPDLPERPLRFEFERFPWINDSKQLAAWRQGRTGFPIVDAGMRQLWHTGWMHNRVRMIVASFLVKDLLIHWRSGESWFWDTLVDADLANNSANWQWVAGCGTDAAPFFRVFNPLLQGAKYDPEGIYVRQWVPELARLPPELLHAPWKARPVDLAHAGVQLGRHYPEPLIDRAAARQRAMMAFHSLKARG